MSDSRKLSRWWFFSLLILPLGLLANTVGFNTTQAKTDVPVAVNLGGVAAAQGSSLAFSPAAHSHPITGALPISNGGTGAATVATGTVFGNNTSGTAAPGFQSTALLIGSSPQLTLGKASATTAGISMIGTTSGSCTIEPPAAAGASHSLVLPTVATTLPAAQPGVNGQALTATTTGVQSYGVLGVVGGGTGLSAPTNHSVLVGAGASAVTPLSVGSTNQFLKGSSGADPAFGTATLASADFANQGTTVQTLHGNGSGNPSWAAVTLTTDVTGTLPTANGGTNKGSNWVAGEVAYASGTTTLAGTGTGATGRVLRSGNTGAPTWGLAEFNFATMNPLNSLTTAKKIAETTVTSASTVTADSKVTYIVTGVGGGNWVVKLCGDGTTCSTVYLTCTVSCVAAIGTATACTVTTASVPAATVLTWSETTACATTQPIASINAHFTSP